MKQALNGRFLARDPRISWNNRARPGALRIRKPSLDSLFRLWTNKAVWESGHWGVQKEIQRQFSQYFKKHPSIF